MRTLITALAVFFTTLPWLNPITPGPAPNIVPWLLTLACVGLLSGILSASTRQFGLASIALDAVDGNFANAFLRPIALLQHFGVASALSPRVNQTNFGEGAANQRQRLSACDANQQWGICSVWGAEGPTDVEIVGYH